MVGQLRKRKMLNKLPGTGQDISDATHTVHY